MVLPSCSMIYGLVRGCWPSCPRGLWLLRRPCERPRPIRRIADWPTMKFHQHIIYRIVVHLGAYIRCTEAVKTGFRRPSHASNCSPGMAHEVGKTEINELTHHTSCRSRDSSASYYDAWDDGPVLMQAELWGRHLRVSGHRTGRINNHHNGIQPQDVRGLPATSLCME